MSLTPTYETEPPPDRPQTATPGGDREDVAAGVGNDHDVAEASTEAPSSIEAVVVLLITSTTTPGVTPAAATIAVGDAQERRVVAGRDQTDWPLAAPALLAVDLSRPIR